MSSALLTKEIIAEAVEILRPGLEAFIIDQQRVVACIVVLDPTIYPPAEPVQIWNGSVGEQDRTKWPRPYDFYASKKAALTFRTRFPSHIVVFDKPHLLVEGDFKYGGSTIRDDLIVATSGLDWKHDLAVSEAVASLCRALCLKESETEFKREPFFIGEKNPAPGPGA